MPNAILNVKDFIFESPQRIQGPPFKICAKQYTNQAPCPDGVTLVLAHGTGFHKECWEPTLEVIMSSQSNHPKCRMFIREAWAFDAPSHGKSASLNRKELGHRMNDISISEIGAAIVLLVTSFLQGHRIVVIGHSAGTSTAMYSTKLYEPKNIPYESVILVEPPMIDRKVFNQNLEDRKLQIGYISKALAKQQSVWPNLKEARAWFQSRQPWNTWNDKVFTLFIKYAIEEVTPGGEVALRCSKQQEVYAFSDFEPTFDALDQIALICKTIPIHVVFGAINDMVPRYSQDTVVDVSKGQKVASIKRIPKAGHLIVQQFPDVLAECVLQLLSPLSSVSKL